MKPLLLFISICISQVVHAQLDDLKQPDSVYRSNHVRLRTINFIRYKKSSKRIELYDQQGRIIEDTYFFPADVIYSKNITVYDSTGRNGKQQGFIYSKRDSITHKRIFNPDEPIRMKWTEFLEYDHSGKLVRAIMQKDDGKLQYETKYLYDSMSQDITLIDYIDTPQLSKHKIVFEKPFVPARSYGYNRRKNHTRKFDFTYTNSFDSQGRLIERVRNITSPYQKEMYEVTLLDKKAYEYNKKGRWLK